MATSRSIVRRRTVENHREVMPVKGSGLEGEVVGEQRQPWT